ncbi:MAG: hypothetical protein IT537_01790 [Hyphomicrobiales bacterium]|nr:hypothetical protein [Hyphomicrobiales bacterium]
MSRSAGWVAQGSTPAYSGCSLFETPLGNLDGGILLDAVAVTESTVATPIPAAPPLFATGLGLIGADGAQTP